MWTSKLGFDTIRRMAKLRQQRWATNSLAHFFINTGGLDKPEVYQYRVNNLNSGGIPEKDFIFSLVKGGFCEKIRYCLKLSWISDKRRKGYSLDRNTQMELLYKSCHDDKFIEYVPQKDNLVRVTTRGTDLIQLAGFINILLEKYGKIEAFLLGGGAIGIVWVISHFRHLFLDKILSIIKL